MIKVTVLNDNSAGRRLLAEHGLSFLVETDNYKILLDAGASEVFRINAQRLKVNLDELDYIVLSHGHWDHGDGLKYIEGKPLICHPEVVKKRYHKGREGSYVGLSLSQEELESRFPVTYTASPFRLTPNCWFLGEIPRENDFESKKTTFRDEEGQEDFVLDDSALALVGEEGLVVISGCAHSGICNTLAYAQKVTGESRIQAVMGGFHLKKGDKVTQKTIQRLREMKIPVILPSHCTDLPALSLFHEAFQMPRINTGDSYEFV